MSSAGSFELNPRTQSFLELGKFLRRVSNLRREILEYNSFSRSLSTWNWPVNPVTGERMAPQALYESSLSNEGSKPVCLCALKDADLSHNIGHGASIAQAQSGLYDGEYIFECSSKKCGYVAPVERIYDNGHYIRSFIPRDCARGNASLKPQHMTHNRRKPLKRSYAEQAQPIHALQQPIMRRRRPVFVIPHQEPPLHHPISDVEFLMRLSSWVQPGLYEREFRELMGRMAQCACGMVMVQDVFDEHRCELGALKPIKRARLH